MKRTLRIVTATLAVLVINACGGDGDGAAQSGPEDPGLGHIHGIGVDPRDQTLYLASHLGLFRVREGRATRVADRFQDTMGFAVVGAGHFLGSGHPDLREDLPSSLGLIESTDAGETWRPLALQGEADFHALEPTPDALYGYDAVTGTVMVSPDREEFRMVARIDAVDIAVDPDDTSSILATTSRGVRAIDASSGQQRPLGGPLLAYIDWPQPQVLVGLAPDGRVHLSEDGGAGWREVGAVPGQAQALEATDEAWYAATTEGLFGSPDQGATWEPIPTQVS